MSAHFLPGETRPLRLVWWLGVALLAGGVLAAVCCFAVAPPLLQAAERGEAFAALNRVAAGKGPGWAGETIGRVQRMGLRAVFLGLLGFAALVGMTRPPFYQRFVGPATPGALGVIRCIVCLILLLNTLWEDLPSIAMLPPSYREPMGLMGVLHKVPGFSHLYTSAPALAALKWATALFLLLGTVGLLTRLALPLALAGFFVQAGLIREYAWFTHVCMVPMYCLLVLCFTPAGDGFSLDRRLRAARGKPVPPKDLAAPVYGWGRYAVWTVIALTYVAAGLSKLRNSGTAWWGADNMRAIMFADSLAPMEFNFKFSLMLVEAPDWFFVLAGIGAIAAELAMATVLFSRVARVVMPLVIAGLHVGILLMQNVFFFDLILLQAVFLPWRQIRLWLARRIGRDPAAGGEPATPEASPIAAPRPPKLRYGLAVAGIVLVFMGWWSTGKEVYPLSGFQMYSSLKRPAGVVQYTRVLAHDASGQSRPAPIDEAVGVLADARYRRLLDWALDAKTPRRQVAAHAVLRDCARVLNEHLPPERQIRSMEVQRHRWNFANHPDDPDYGEVVARVNIEIPGAAEPRAVQATAKAPASR